MGIDYDAILVYGMEFDFSQVSDLKYTKEFIELAEEIGCNELPNLWQEYDYGEIVKGLTSSPHFDCPEDYCNYIIGIDLKKKDLQFIKNIDEEVVKKELNRICDELGLEPVKIKIICNPNIW